MLPGPTGARREGGAALAESPGSPGGTTLEGVAAGDAWAGPGGPERNPGAW